MGALQMDSENLRSVSEKVTEVSNSLSSLTAKFNSETQSITDPSVWNGPDSKLYAELASSIKTNLESAVKLLSETGERLNGTANSYDETLESVSGNIRNSMNE